VELIGSPGNPTLKNVLIANQELGIGTLISLNVRDVDTPGSLVNQITPLALNVHQTSGIYQNECNSK